MWCSLLNSGTARPGQSGNSNEIHAAVASLKNTYGSASALLPLSDPSALQGPVQVDRSALGEQLCGGARQPSPHWQWPGACLAVLPAPFPVLAFSPVADSSAVGRDEEGPRFGEGCEAERRSGAPEGGEGSE